MHRRETGVFPGKFLPVTALLAALLVSASFPQRLLPDSPAMRGKTVSIVVDYEGSWKLRYKLYYQEIADSEVRELHGIGKYKVSVSAERELVNLCAWLTPTGVAEERERLGLSIVVDDGAARFERKAPPSLFSNQSSVCFHF